MRLVDADVLLENIRHRLGVKSLDYVTQQEKVIIKEIMSAPSITWVPCEERLPDRLKDDVYLIRDPKGRITLSNFDLTGQWVISRFFDVVAWMPLPPNDASQALEVNYETK